MSDEAGELRAALERGEWRRLTDPLLELVLLEDASWWPEAAIACAHDIALDLMPRGSLAGWSVDTLQALNNCTRWWDPMDPRILPVVLAATRQAPPGRVSAPMRDALAVLERWPAG